MSIDLQYQELAQRGFDSQKSLYSLEYDHDSCGAGFVVQMKGEKSHDIIEKALTILHHLEHRGACGCEANTGDGAGILMQIPHEFLQDECEKIGINLPKLGQYGVGFFFVPRDEAQKGMKLFEKIVKEQGQVLLGWRDVPFNDFAIGASAKKAMPHFKQVFIGLGPKGANLPGDLPSAFERRLYILRKSFENQVRQSSLKNKNIFYFPSLSCKTMVYKGMLISYQLSEFYPDLKNPKMISALALVHSRFSTNTLPNWELAHPFRYICHNGEINTLRGNINWMRAREALFESKLFGDEINNILPVLKEGASDSATFDMALELLVMAGYTLPHAIMMMIPEAWSGHKTMPQDKKDFYEYHSCLMEPWDGPASIPFTDGKQIGAVLDRNGLRPSRYWVTKDDLVIMASEVGVLDIPPENIVYKGRLQPGRMFLIDIEKGKIIDDAEIKKNLSLEKPYGSWIQKQMISIEDLPGRRQELPPSLEDITKEQVIFGYSLEDKKILMEPMAKDGEEAIGSMGNDAQLAVLAERPQTLFAYFKQLFAQVTNPPLDAIREELVTSVTTTIGSEQNLLNPTELGCHHIKLTNPVIDNDQLIRLKELEMHPFKGFQSKTLPILFKAKDGLAGLEEALKNLFAKTSEAIEKGCNLIILSDRGVNQEWAPIPSLLATAGLHHHLVRQGTRTKVGLVIESGEPREVHHFCLLVGYGAGAVNPYLAFETLSELITEGYLTDMNHEETITHFQKAIKKGLVKVMSKIGISTIQSYRGAQIFEAIGLNQEVIDHYFTHTASRIQGIGLKAICEETLNRHRRAFPQRYSEGLLLDLGGDYQWRRGGPYHLLNPDTVAKLQQATSTNRYDIFKDYSATINEQTKHLCTLRGLFKFKKKDSIPLEEVEPVTEIVKRFKTGAMSYGSISKEAHETLAIAMNRIGGKSNTGEGGEDPARYTPDSNGDSRKSAIKQVASGRFGVTSEYLVNCDELQIKIAQGAKPGEGGQLPGNKVYPWIAKVRFSTPYVGLISPPPHHDIYSIEDLAQLIFDLKNANHQARVSVKLVAEVGVGTVAAGVSKAHADVVLIAGHDGGTGASPLTSIKHAGVPWELGLAETQQILVANNLRDRIRIEVDGQMKTGRDVVIGALLGGEEFGFATAPLVTMGCIMMRVCHLDTCPVGIATQNPELRKQFKGTPDAVIKFFMFIAQEVREIMAELGFKKLDDMIGRSDLLNFNDVIAHWKSKGLDFSPIFYRPEVGAKVATRCVTKQDHGLEKILDNKLVEICQEALIHQKVIKAELPINNTNRTTGTMLGSELTRRYGAKGLPPDTITLKFNGSAGQSFGAFIPNGMTLILEGDANDYTAKGLSGGKVIVYPPKKASFVPEENILVGNVVLYGATSGEAYFRGIAGERFCVRNSGAKAVVEGVGDHGCEYMTGGRVVVLGPTGRNFAAGMSGGIAYVYDPRKEFNTQCNQNMVDLDLLRDEEDLELVQQMLKKHWQYTGSTLAQKVLDNLTKEVKNFVKVMPRDYKKALVEVRQKMEEKKISEYEAMYGT